MSNNRWSTGDNKSYFTCGVNHDELDFLGHFVPELLFSILKYETTTPTNAIHEIKVGLNKSRARILAKSRKVEENFSCARQFDSNRICESWWCVSGHSKAFVASLE